MDRSIQNHAGAYQVERILTVVAAIICFAVTAWFWTAIAGRQPMWPLPAAYLIEVVLLTVLAAVAAVRKSEINWELTLIAAGALLAFAVLGLFSIGLFYLPIAGLLLVAGVLSTWAAGRSALAAATWYIVSAAVQVTIMLAAISVVR